MDDRSKKQMNFILEVGKAKEIFRRALIST